jgi:two-component system sensor kinase FixL
MMCKVRERQFGNKAGTIPPAPANDPRQLRIGALEGVAPTLIHELAQPLSAAMAYLDNCAFRIRGKGAGMEDLLADIERAQAQAQRATAILRNLREFALQGRVASRPEPLRRVIDDALAAVSGIDEVDLEFGYHAAGVCVAGDRIQLVQLFANLFANAVQAMRESPVKTLRIVTAAAGDDMLIRIEDSGPGLSGAVYAQLFEPFVTTRPDGNGLGLPICATIVRAHDGRIWVDPPQSGMGAAFNLSLPARIRQLDDAA